MMGVMDLRMLWNDVLDILLPRYCTVCQQRLKGNERCLCVSCLQRLPVIRQKDVWDNLTVRLFWGKVNIQKGFSLLAYHKDTESQHIFSQMKYRGRDDLCREMGRMLAFDAKRKDFFEDIDAIVPVPLHDNRRRERGYNQSEQIARGISSVTGIPVDTCVVQRIRDTRSQVTMDIVGRRENVKGAFHTDASRLVAYRHLLLVDDTITTGSTVLEMMKELQRAAPSCHFSVCSIGLVLYE